MLAFFFLLSLKSLQDLSQRTGNCLIASASFPSRAATFFALALPLKGTCNEFFQWLIIPLLLSSNSVHLALTGSEAMEAEVVSEDKETLLILLTPSPLNFRLRLRFRRYCESLT